MKFVRGAFPRGVALILVNPEGKILTLQERISKPWLGKYRGMYSIPMETKKFRESDQKALERLVAQELDGLETDIEPDHRGEYQVVPGVWASLYVGTSGAVSPPQTNGSREVGEHAWMNAEKALTLWLRQGAEEMIADYIAGRKAVHRRNCRQVSEHPPL